MDFQNLLDGYRPYEQLKNALNSGKTPVSVSGIVEPAQAQLISALSSGRTALIVVYSDFEARRLYEDLLLYTDKAHVFCEKEYVFYNIDARDHSREFERLSALDSIREGGIIIASVGACMSYTLPKAKLDTMCLEFHTGEEYDTDCLTRKLIDMGYRREDITEAAGQFSLRGGILDIFSPNSDSPVRIEFFDTEVDSIRYYDASTQRSLSQERE